MHFIGSCNYSMLKKIDVVSLLPVVNQSEQLFYSDFFQDYKQLMCYYFTYCLINNDNEQYFRFVYLPLPNYISPLTFIGTYLYTPIYLSTYRPIYLYISTYPYSSSFESYKSPFSTYLPSQTFYTISFFVPRWCLFLSVFVFAPSDKVLGLAQPNI